MLACNAAFGEDSVIPALADGVLPEGIFECTLEELDEVFGRFQRSDRRIGLTQKLRQYLEDARRSGIAAAVVIDGSFVTGKAEPSDIDLILALRPDFDLGQELRPFEYNIQSRRMVKNVYRFDLRVAPDGSELYLKHVEFFANVRPDDPEQTTNQSRKGLLRIAL